MEKVERGFQLHFGPGNQEWVGRDHLRELKHSDTIKNYTNKFLSLMLDTRNMYEKDNVYPLINSLHPWRKRKL